MNVNHLAFSLRGVGLGILHSLSVPVCVCVCFFSLWRWYCVFSRRSSLFSKSLSILWDCCTGPEVYQGTEWREGRQKWKEGLIQGEWDAESHALSRDSSVLSYSLRVPLPWFVIPQEMTCPEMPLLLYLQLSVFWLYLTFVFLLLYFPFLLLYPCFCL